jgi:hypothetical protein
MVCACQGVCNAFQENQVQRDDHDSESIPTRIISLIKNEITDRDTINKPLRQMERVIPGRLPQIIIEPDSDDSYYYSNNGMTSQTWCGTTIDYVMVTNHTELITSLFVIGFLHLASENRLKHNNVFRAES